MRFSHGRTGREPERLRLSLRRRRRDPRAGWITHFKKPTLEFPGWFMVGFVAGAIVGFQTVGPIASPADNLAVGLVAGLVAGLAVGFRTGLVVGLGLVAGLAFVFVGGPMMGVTARLTADLVAGFAVGFALGLPNVVVSALGDTYDPHATDPWTLLARDRTVTVVQTIATTVIAGGFALGFSFGGYINLAVGLFYAPVFGIVRLALSAWGN